MDRLFRILLDPAPPPGGAQNPPAAAAEPTPAPPTAPALDPAVAAELARLRAFEATTLAGQRQTQQQQQQAQTRQLAKDGQIEKLVEVHNGQIKEKDDALSALRARAHGMALSAALSRALGGRADLRPGAAKHLAALWKDDFEVVEQGDEFVARSRADARAVEAVVGERLKHADYGLYVLPSTQGGGGAAGGGQPVPTPAGGGQPDNLFTRMKAARQGAGQAGTFGFGAKPA